LGKDKKLKISKLLFLTLMLLFCFSFGLIFGYSLPIGLVIFGAISLAAFIFYKTHLGIIIGLFAIPFDRLAKITPEGTLTVAKVFILLTLIAWFTKTILAKDDRLVTVPFYNFIGVLGVAFLLVSFISIVNANDKALWFGQQIRRTNIVLLYMLLLGLIDNRNLLKKALYATLFASFFVSLTGIYELVTQTPVLSLVGISTELDIIEGGNIRISGPAGDPDFHAVSMIFPSAIAIYIFYISRSKIIRGLMIFLLALFLINIFGTGSRGGLIGLAITFGIFWYFAKIRWKWIKTFSIASIAGAIVILFVYLFPSAPTSRYTGETGEKTFEYRLGWMDMGFRMIKDHPIIGIGTANFLETYNRYIVPTVPRDPDLPHNSFLQIWVENGTPAFFIYIALYLFAIKNLWIVVKNSKDEELQPMAIALLGVILGLAFFAMTSNVLENENYWILFAYSVIVSRLYAKERE
jgi:O-antigen ligase